MAAQVVELIGFATFGPRGFRALEWHEVAEPVALAQRALQTEVGPNLDSLTALSG